MCQVEGCKTRFGINWVNMADKNKTMSQEIPNNGSNSGDSQQMGGQSSSNDDELDDLLDSALEDFGKPAPPSTGQNAQNTDLNPTCEVPSGDAALPPMPGLPPGMGNQDEMFSQVFDAAFGGEEGSQQLEDMLKAFLDPETLNSIERIAEAAGETDDTDESKQKFEDTLRNTLGSLAQNAEDLQADVGDDDLVRMMSGMMFQQDQAGPAAAGGAGPEGADFMPMMHTMMQSLISKDVLYPSLKDISNKYPAWLEENKGKVDDSEYERFKKQNEYMQAICVEFEKESATDTDSVKKERFDRILDLMQHMQELGYPPKEITGDIPQGMPGMPGMPGLSLDENGMPRMPGGPDQCSLM